METTNYNLNDLLLPLSTGLIFLGGFPAAPTMFTNLIANEWFRWLLVLNLIWQGGGRQHLNLSIVATIMLYIIVKLLDGAYISGMAACPTIQPLATQQVATQPPK